MSSRACGMTSGTTEMIGRTDGTTGSSYGITGWTFGMTSKGRSQKNKCIKLPTLPDPWLTPPLETSDT